MYDATVYDYVIVGAGSAGCVLAARLSEDPETRVLLLEAGPPDDADEIRIPAAVNLLWKTAYDWDYSTVPQERAGGRSIFWPRGKTLGGSSSINAMIYIRGNRYDYDSWRDEYGCTGWGYNDLLPYFLRSEDNSHGASAYHGAGGPLSVQDLRYKSTLTKAFVEAAVTSGLERNPDFNGASQDGAGFYQVTQRNGRRCSTADAFLRPALGRPNLIVETDALVTRIEMAGDRADAVHYLQRGARQTARADREIILSAGTIGSPQILMLSGIGPAAHLREHGIDVVADSPGVGANLSDHPIVTAMWHTPKVRGVWEHTGPVSLLRWQLTHNGPLVTNVAEAGGFSRSDSSLSAPDLQWFALPVPYENQGLIDAARRAFSLLVTLVDVHSRGRITLRSADPRHKPAIDPAYLSDSTDLDRFVTGLDLARQFAAAKPLAKMCTSELAPGPEVRGDAELREFVRRNVATLYHPVGTCAMGGDSRLAASRLNSVVDPELRVRGVTALRVVDASVMPVVPRGNTNAPTIAIAERAADLIAGRAPLAAADPEQVPALVRS
ncbi:MAG TPA: GMC family oxidoreductase N-terminal domain-containing protein [Streptosporangiaceae bacterium]|nr:GMC family oxidoreductase N-terminal domain-containing protein [Streptosporangiaceae bacterium]